MRATLQALASLLARDPLTVEQVIQEIGAVTHEYSGSVLVAPRDPLFTEASVVRQIDPSTRKPSDTPAHVKLTPADPPSVDTLARAFGTYTRVPAREKVPLRLIFYLDMPGQPCTIALIARVRQDRAVSIILRRDRRL